MLCVECRFNSIVAACNSPRFPFSQLSVEMYVKLNGNCSVHLTANDANEIRAGKSMRVNDFGMNFIVQFRGKTSRKFH